VAPTYLPSVDAVEEFKVQQSNFQRRIRFLGCNRHQCHHPARARTPSTAAPTSSCAMTSWMRTIGLTTSTEIQGSLSARTTSGSPSAALSGRTRLSSFFDYDGTRARTFRVRQWRVCPRLLNESAILASCVPFVAPTFDGRRDSAATQPARFGIPTARIRLWEFRFDPRLFPFNSLITYQRPREIPTWQEVLFQPRGGSRQSDRSGGTQADADVFRSPLRRAGSFEDLASNWFGSGVNRSSNNQFDIKVDHRFSSSDLLSVKYSQQWGQQSQFSIVSITLPIPCHWRPG